MIYKNNQTNESFYNLKKYHDKLISLEMREIIHKIVCCKLGHNRNDKMMERTLQHIHDIHK